MSEALEIVVSAQAAEQIRAAAEWWRRNRPKAPNAIGEDLDRASECDPGFEVGWEAGTIFELGSCRNAA